jgi:H+/Cl- antiporter ClcA
MISKLISGAAKMIPNRSILAVVIGAWVGLVSYALPMTATAGSNPLGIALEISGTMGTGFLAAILIGKKIAIALNQSSGFLGGIVLSSQPSFW